MEGPIVVTLLQNSVVPSEARAVAGTWSCDARTVGPMQLPPLSSSASWALQFAAFPSPATVAHSDCEPFASELQHAASAPQPEEASPVLPSVAHGGDASDATTPRCAPPSTKYAPSP